MSSVPLRRRLAAIALPLLVASAAFALRCARIEQVAGGETIQIFHDDPPYHLRRALMTLETWPRVPGFDPMLSFPDGAEVTWPPGMAWLLAGTSRMLGARGPADRVLVEKIAISLPPLLGALTVLALYLAARRLLGAAPALLAALALAVQPAHAEYTVIGRFDHHLFEALLAWLLLLAVARAAEPASRRWRWVATGGAVIGAAFLLVPGAILHLGLIACALLLAAAVLRGEPAARLARAAALTFAAGALASLPALLLSPWALRPVFFAMSPLQVACVAAAAALFAALGAGTTRLPALARAGIALAAVALPLARPSLRHALVDGLRYTLGSPFSALASESRGLLADPRDFVVMTGWPALLGTLAAGVLLARGARDAESHAETVMASAGLVLLAAGAHSVRWLVAWAPLGAFAVALAWTRGLRPLGARWLPARPRRWATLLAALAILLAVPPVLHLLSLDLATAQQRRVTRFCRELRALTPAASTAEHSSVARPSYGILATWSIGHLLTYHSGRPTLANNFFGAPLHDRANARAFRLLLSPDCDGAAAQMARLRLRYLLITPPEPRELPVMARIGGHDPAAFLGPTGELLAGARRSLWLRLGPADGQSIALEGERLPACGRFRLVAELPSGDASPGSLKLFEQVRGAALEVRASPGAPVALSLPLRTRHGRELLWFAQAAADARGTVRLRLPYPSDGSCWSPVRPCPVVARSAYRLAIAGRETSPLVVSEEAIAAGLTLRR